MNEKRFNRDIERLRDADRLERLEVERVVNLALEGLAEPRTVLDVGVGSGVFAEAFAARGLQASGVDVNPAMLPVARSFVPGGDFREAAAERLPHDDRTFDLVFMGLLLHETDDPLDALREARRVGRQRLAVLEWPVMDQPPVGPPLEHRISEEQVRKLAKAAGYQTFKTIPLNVLVLFLME